MLHCRRGSVAFATVVALVPLIGFVALGAEAGSWYVTKQQAQNAADAAAYSGGLRLQCSTVANGGGAACADAQSIDYRARQFAAQNTFCDGSDTNSYSGSRCPTSLPSGISRNVSIAVTATQVQATVTQTQPTYLANLLGLSTVTIGATATAEVKQLAFPCVLTLADPLVFQGNTTIKSPNCGLSSNDTDKSGSIQFTGNSVNLNQVKSVSGVGGCSDTGGSQCNAAITSASSTPNPLSGLDTAISSLKITDFPSGACSVPGGNSPIALAAYGTSNKCYYNGPSFQNKNYTLNGVYFIDGQFQIQGNLTGTATLIFLPPKFTGSSDPGGSLKISGNPTIQITALSSITASQVPTSLGTAANLTLLTGIVIYDPEASSNLKITGSSTSYFNGITYAPNADLTYQGNATQTNSCNEVIAKGVTLSGSSNFDNSACPVSNPAAFTHYVRLVQ
nr:pilus assembly protein TadG-related protein [Bradyrhizobium manausense]